MRQINLGDDLSERIAMKSGERRDAQVREPGEPIKRASMSG
jgi:hypothetical protein